MVLEKKRVLVIVFLGAAVLSGCSNVSSSISAYHAAAPQVQLGMSKEQVLAILEPTQNELSLSQRRAPEQYTLDGKHVEIRFFRSYCSHNEVRSDDEFTPYVFHNGILQSIGWTAIGGPKTQAIPRPEEHITIIR
ncbi:MAG: hypothetical protein L0Y36_01755 [Planctomycetales bacterium]|nr:hypothetical protein [Planctomycetales bacterium]